MYPFVGLTRVSVCEKCVSVLLCMCECTHMCVLVYSTECARACMCLYVAFVYALRVHVYVLYKGVTCERSCHARLVADGLVFTVLS